MSTRKRKRSRAVREATQKERALLCACLPDEWAGNWLEEFDYQNTCLLDSGEEPLKHHEFIKCRLEDLALGQNRQPW